MNAQMVNHPTIIYHGHSCLTSVSWPFTLTAITLTHACIVRMLTISRMDEQ